MLYCFWRTCSVDRWQLPWSFEKDHEKQSRSKKPVAAFSRHPWNFRRGIYPQYPDHSRYYPFFETRLCCGQCRPWPGTGHPLNRKRHIDPHIPFALGQFNQHPRQGRRYLLPDIQNPRPGIRRRYRHCHVSGPVGIHRVLLYRLRWGAGGNCFRRTDRRGCRSAASGF